MPEWAGWVLAIAVAILYFRSWNRAEAAAVSVNVQTEINDLRREIRVVWTRCGMLEGYTDSMTEHIIDSDSMPDIYDPVSEAAKRWQEWRKEQLARSHDQ